MMSVALSQQHSTIESEFAALFPLPLTPLEAYMVADARNDYPMMCDLELHFSGKIDRPAFESALAWAVARNPLFIAHVRLLPDKTLAWVAGDEQPRVQWVTLDEPLGATYGAPTDLGLQAGLRIWVRQGADAAQVLLHFHHACADAIGAFGFIEDLLAGYTAVLPGAEPVAPRTLAPRRLLHRGTVGTTGRSLARKIRDVVKGAQEGAKFFLQSPLPLVGTPGGRPAARTTPPPCHVTETLPEHVALGLRKAAADAGATTNDVLMRDLFLALRDWNQSREGVKPRRRLRILMPQNLREREDSAMPAANVMSFAFVTRRAARCDNPQALLHSIRAETEAVRRGRLSLYFSGALGTLQAAGWLPWILARRFCFASAVLTNLSDPTRRFVAQFPRTADGKLAVGNLTFHGITGIPPLRPLTHAAFSVFNSAKICSISFKWDLLLSDQLDGLRLLGEYVKRLHATAEAALPRDDGQPSSATTP